MEWQNLRQSVTDVERKCVPVSARLTPDPSPCCIVCFHSAIGHGAVNCVIIYHQVLKAMTSNVSVDCTDADVNIFFTCSLIANLSPLVSLVQLCGCLIYVVVFVCCYFLMSFS